MTAFLLFLVVTALFRLTELVISRRNWRHHRHNAEMVREPLFFWMVLLHIGFFVLILLETQWGRPQFGGPLSWIALVMTAFAVGLRFWVLKSLGPSWNVRVIQGRDYPIISHGPYRWIRHPNYLVVILEIAFIPLIMHLYWSALILSIANAMVLWSRIRTEEQALARNPEWRRRMSAKPRFLPFI